MKPEAARALELTDRKSLLALRGVGRESEAEGVRFGCRLTKVGPQVKVESISSNSGSKGYSWAQMRIEVGLVG